MNFFLKLSASMAVIIFCTQIGRRFPTFSGLIATMPLTGLIILVWLYLDNRNNHDLMINYTRGAVWGILPTILFFLVALFCFKKHLPLHVVLSAGLGVWLIGAFIHQWFLH